MSSRFLNITTNIQKSCKIDKNLTKKHFCYYAKSFKNQPLLNVEVYLGVSRTLFRKLLAVSAGRGFYEGKREKGLSEYEVQ